MRMNHLRPVLLRGVAALGLMATSALLFTGAAFAQPKPPPLPTLGGAAALPTTKPQALPPLAGTAPPQAIPPQAGLVPAPPAAPSRPPVAAAPPAPPATAASRPPAPTPATPGTPPAAAGTPGLRAVSSGTAFIVAQRRLMTNAHVVVGCTEMRARRQDGTEIVARVDAADEHRDLAILTAAADLGPALNFRVSPEPRRGESVVTYGFPLASLLSSGPSLTTGDISALGGMNNNLRMMQISAPIQPGNSGGPLFDMGGLVIGVVVATLNPHRVGERTVTPQNVNFAVKGAEALAFLREQNVAVTPLPAREPLRGAAADVGDLAHRSVLFLRCFR